MHRALFGVMLAGLFVLLLSALVVTPETEPPAVSPLMPHDFHAVMTSAALPSAQADLSAPEPAEELQMRSQLPKQHSADETCRRASADSNGRVLRSLRYENSFYQLFRPEVAGG